MKRRQKEGEGVRMRKKEEEGEGGRGREGEEGRTYISKKPIA
jgi:hypothetical protein